MPGKAGWSGPAVRRVAAVGLLLAVVVVALRAHGRLASAGDPGLLTAGRTVIYEVLAVLEAVAAVLGVLVILAMFGRRRKRPEDEGEDDERKPLPWWAHLLVALLALIVLGVPAALVVLWLHLHPLAQGGSPPPALPAGGRLTGRAPAPAGPPWSLLAGVAAALALAALFLVATWRLRARAGRRGFTPLTPLPTPAPLAQALAAGAFALTDAAGPREAIIACYAAMEHCLAEAGSPPGAADTPAEVLARAAAGGLITSAAAGTLTGLFRRARYSEHPVTEADRTLAGEALTQLRDELGIPA